MVEEKSEAVESPIVPAIEARSSLQKQDVDMEGTPEKQLKYPKSVFFIVSNEFCERFSYYGMRTILSIYLVDMLLFDNADAKIIYHTFTMLVYFFPILGAMLADSLLGKFRTIFYVSIVYALGNVVLAIAATPVIDMPHMPISMLGLLLIALGTGGIKPCVAAFGGDQFILPQQEKQLAAFFSMFYFAINFGSFVSTFITPILREQECFGEAQCFTLAFGVPGVLMVVSIIIFGAGKRLYLIRQPEGNMVIKVSSCIGNAIKLKVKSKEKREHWLDYSEEKYGKKLVDEVKATLRVLLLYIPLPVFWALFDQQGTGWTFMARRMDGDIGFYTILPDQMQVVNPVLILVFIPLFEYCIYPIFNKLKLFRTPLQRLVVGGMLAAVAFAISAGISLAIEAEDPILPEPGSGHMIFYNNRDCDMKVEGWKNDFELKAFEFKHIQDSVTGNKTEQYTVTACGETVSMDFTWVEEKTVGHAFDENNKFGDFIDSLQKDVNGFPRLRVLVSGAKNVFNILDTDNKNAYIGTNNSQFHLPKPGNYKLEVDGWQSEEFELRLGGVYTLLTDKPNQKMELKTITESNGIHMLFLIPQYVVMTMGEIMFSVTGLEFAYSQSPTSMKSVMQACWLLTTAFGNLIIVIIESVEIFEKESYNFFLYAGIMVIDMVIFSLMAMGYKYVEKESEKKEDESDEGIDNKAYLADSNKEL